MARTEVPYSSLVGNGALADPTPTTADATNDHVINAAVPERTLLRVYNTAVSAKTVTIVAGDYPPAIASGQGGLTVSVGASGIQWLGPFESGRFLQKDGTLEVDLESGFTGSLTAFKVPKAV